MNQTETLDIRITKTPQSRISGVDFDNLGFGKIKSDHMFIAQFRNGEWTNLEIKPYDYLQLSPACIGLHYGQSIFEGMKAYRNVDGKICVFRPERNIERMQHSAERMAMEPIPTDVFMEGMRQLLELDQDWVPTGEGKSLYLRPFQFGDEPNIGVRESDGYTFIIFTCPTGKYYDKDVSVYVADHYIRAARGGAGFAKAAGNYAPTLLPARLAKKFGYDQVLWTQLIDGKRYVQEIGTMNFFVQIDDVLITPELDGTILEGITRESLITLARDMGVKVEERMLTVEELFLAAKEGRVKDAFGAGTAAVITQISAIGHGIERVDLPAVENRTLSHELKKALHEIRIGEREDKYGWMMHI